MPERCHRCWNFQAHCTCGANALAQAQGVIEDTMLEIGFEHIRECDECADLWSDATGAPFDPWDFDHFAAVTRTFQDD